MSVSATVRYRILTYLSRQAPWYSRPVLSTRLGTLSDKPESYPEERQYERKEHEMASYVVQCYGCGTTLYGTMTAGEPCQYSMTGELCSSCQAAADDDDD